MFECGSYDRVTSTDSSPTRRILPRYPRPVILSLVISFRVDLIIKRRRQMIGAL